MRRGTLLLLAPLSGVACAGRLPEDAEAILVEGGDRLTFERVLARFHELNVGLEREMGALVLQRASELAVDARKRRGYTFAAIRQVEYRQALSTDARVSLHEAMDAAAGTELLASNTGGLRVSGDLKQGLTRILDTTKTYYVLGYEPPQKKKPGFRKIKVAVKAKGLKVLARRGYFDDRRPDQSGASPSGRPPR